MSRKVVINEKNEERKAIALKGGQPDAVPVDVVNLCSFLAGWLKFKALDYYKNPEFMLDCQLKFRERFRGIGMVGPDYGVVVEPSCFGARIVWTSNDSPWVMHMIDDVDDIPDYAERLEIPHPLMSGYLPLVHSTYFYMREQVGEAAAPPVSVTGPFDVACSLLGTENVLLGIRLYPDDVHKLLKKLTVFLKNVLEAKYELFGLDMNIIHVCEDNPGLLSSDDFEEFVLPYTGDIYNSLAGSGTIRMWHCDGRLSHLMDVFPKLGINALMSFDPKTDLALFKEKLGNKMSLFGNIDPMGILLYGSREQIEEEVKRLMDIGKVGGGYGITTGGELSEGISEENIDIYLDAAEMYGKY